MRLPIEEVADIISSSTDFKPNVAVVIIDFLVCQSLQRANYAVGVMGFASGPLRCP